MNSPAWYSYYHWYYHHHGVHYYCQWSYFYYHHPRDTLWSCPCSGSTTWYVNGECGHGSVVNDSHDSRGAARAVTRHT